eukprot:gene5009-6394_t
MSTTIESLSTGSQIMTIAGSGTGGSAPIIAIGDGGLATASTISKPGGLKIDPTTGFISIVAGQYSGGPATGTTIGTPYGDFGQATSAYLSSPYGIAGKDASGVVYFSDFSTYKIRKV